MEGRRRVGGLVIHPALRGREPHETLLLPCCRAASLPITACASLLPARPFHPRPQALRLSGPQALKPPQALRSLQDLCACTSPQRPSHLAAPPACSLSLCVVAARPSSLTSPPPPPPTITSHTHHRRCLSRPQSSAQASQITCHTAALSQGELPPSSASAERPRLSSLPRRPRLHTTPRTAHTPSRPSCAACG